MLGSAKFRNTKKVQKNWQKVSPSSPGTKNEFRITLIAGAKKCLKKPPNANPNPSKVFQVSTLSLFISSGPKTIPKSRRVHQNKPNWLRIEVISELQNIFCLFQAGSSPKAKCFLGEIPNLDCKKGYLGKKL